MVIQYPNFGPWSHDIENYLWIDIKVYEIINQQTLARGSANDIIPVRVLDDSFRLLAPRELQFAASHDWRDYENITSRLADVLSSWMIPSADIYGIIQNNLSGFFSGNESKATLSSGTIWNKIQSLAGSTVTNYRVDTPLVYKSSTPIII